MGLDMFGFSVPKDADLNDESTQQVELMYWRKFNALHGWMEDLWRSRGGSSTGEWNEFNCVAIQLTEKDLDDLLFAVTYDQLVPREGFFFGSQEIHPDDVKDTYKFIVRARQAIKEGSDVYYDSWW